MVIHNPTEKYFFIKIFHMKKLPMSLLHLIVILLASATENDQDSMASYIDRCSVEDLLKTQANTETMKTMLEEGPWKNGDIANPSTKNSNENSH